MRYKLTLEYIGSNYSGSQKQKNASTIQEELEKAICTLTKTKIKTVFAGRTDRGVHAKGQVAHFDTEKLNETKFLKSLNALLPDDISVRKIERVEDSFHSQKSAKWRHYRYVIFNSPVKTAWNTAIYHIKYDLDVEKMKRCLEKIKGEHNFSAFKSRSDNPAEICTIYEAKIDSQGDGQEKFITIDIIGNRFLYNMVRTIVGTLIKVKDEKEFEEILNSKDRTKAGKTISPEGLTLIKTGYEEYTTKET